MIGGRCAIYDGVRGNCCRNMCRSVRRSAFVRKVSEQWQKHGNNYVGAWWIIDCELIDMWLIQHLDYIGH